MADQRQQEGAVEFTVDELDYSLPEELIAQHPPARREDARMLVVQREAGSIRDSRITELPEWLSAGDLLVLNDTRVIPAKIFARRKTGGKAPGLFLREIEASVWEVLLEGSARLRLREVLDLLPAASASAGTQADSKSSVKFELLERMGEGRWQVRVDDPRSAAEILETFGQTPLPPYIGRKSERAAEAVDRERYQTVYARRPGAVAAPTAGLHLTESLLQQIHDRGVDIARVTLHVGPGTFKPISTMRLADHVMHEEQYEIQPETLQAIKRCRARGGRIVAVGTTTVRVLETVGKEIEGLRKGSEANVEKSTSQKVEMGRDEPTSTGTRGVTDIFIRPPYRFHLVDALLTNFHLPRSTLLALVMALAGIDLTRRAYEHAIAQHYRFFSYGDAVLIV